jgi:FkbM family methyltransferase
MRRITQVLLSRLGGKGYKQLLLTLLRLTPRRFGISIEVTARTSWGEEMTVALPDVVSVSIFRLGFYEAGLTKMIHDYLRPGMIFYDVGAHYGYFSLLASRIVGDTGSVHAFEPGRETYRILLSNVSRKRNIVPRNIALYSREGRLPFHDYGPPLSAFNSLYAPRIAANSRRHLRVDTYEVEATSLDNYVRDFGHPPDFVKLDAESAEFEILKGMDCTFRNYRPFVTVEVGDMSIPGAARSRDLLQHIIEQGYRLLECRNGRIVGHRLKEVYQYDNILCVPSEVSGTRSFNQG